MSGSIGPKSVSGQSLSKGDEGVCNICFDSVSKQISASKYGWRGLVRLDYLSNEIQILKNGGWVGVVGLVGVGWVGMGGGGG